LILENAMRVGKKRTKAAHARSLGDVPWKIITECCPRTGATPSHEPAGLFPLELLRASGTAMAVATTPAITIGLVKSIFTGLPPPPPNWV